MIHELGLMTEDEARQAFAERRLVLLPVGSLEQHGPHLPAATDAIVAARLSLAIATALDGIVLPTITYGNSFSWNAGWTSTVTLAQGRLADLVYDIGKSIARKGPRFLLIFNGHGGNPPDIVSGAKRLKEECPDLEILVVEWWAAGASVIAALKESAAESHSGEFETSIMMHLAPEMVRLDHLTAEFEKHVPELCYQHLIVKVGGDKIKRIQYYTPDISASGVYGDPTSATPAKGAAIVQRVIENTRRVLDELDALNRRA